MRAVRITYSLFCLFAFQLVQAQPLTRETLEDSVYRLNNQLKFKESQALLLPRIAEKSRSADEKYHFCILLSYTYKRVFDYESAMRWLDEAEKFALQTKNKASLTAEVQTERALNLFDTHQYKASDSIMNILEKTGFRYIPQSNQAKLIMQQGYLRFLDKKYGEAELTYNRALANMKVSSPCDLPMILVKKMQLYAAMNQQEKMEEAYHLSEKSADSCKIIKYNLYAAEELLTIYKQRKDMPQIARLSLIIDSLNRVYQKGEQISTLLNQKEEILMTGKNRELNREKQEKSYLVIWVAVFAVLSTGLTWVMIRYRKQKLQADAEIQKMKGQLAAYLQLSSQNEVLKQETEKHHVELLSDRQREVLTYMSEGLSNKEIGERLFISENTVKYHIRIIYQTLKIKHRKDLGSRMSAN